MAKKAAPKELEDLATCLEYNAYLPNLCTQAREAFDSKIREWMKQHADD